MASLTCRRHLRSTGTRPSTKRNRSGAIGRIVAPTSDLGGKRQQGTFDRPARPFTRRMTDDLANRHEIGQGDTAVRGVEHRLQNQGVVVVSTTGARIILDIQRKIGSYEWPPSRYGPSAWMRLRPARCDGRGSGSLVAIPGHNVQWIVTHLRSELKQNLCNNVF